MQMQDNIRDHYFGGYVIVFKPYPGKYPDVLRYVSHDENIDGTSLLCNAKVFCSIMEAKLYIEFNSYANDAEYVSISINASLNEYYAKKLDLIGKMFRINGVSTWYRLDDRFNIVSCTSKFVSNILVSDLLSGIYNITEIKEISHEKYSDS